MWSKQCKCEIYDAQCKTHRLQDTLGLQVDKQTSFSFWRDARWAKQVKISTWQSNATKVTLSRFHIIKATSVKRVSIQCWCNCIKAPLMTSHSKHKSHKNDHISKSRNGCHFYCFLGGCKLSDIQFSKGGTTKTNYWRHFFNMFWGREGGGDTKINEQESNSSKHCFQNTSNRTVTNRRIGLEGTKVGLYH